MEPGRKENGVRNRPLLVRQIRRAAMPGAEVPRQHRPGRWRTDCRVLHPERLLGKRGYLFPRVPRAGYLSGRTVGLREVVGEEVAADDRTWEVADGITASLYHCRPLGQGAENPTPRKASVVLRRVANDKGARWIRDNRQG